MKKNSNELEWLKSLLKIGVTFFSSDSISAVMQAANEVEGNSIESRINKLEDPIGSLHVDMIATCKFLYHALYRPHQNSLCISMNKNVFEKYSKPLSLLKGHGYLEFSNSAASAYPSDITLNNPFLIVYAAAVSGVNDKLNKITEKMDSVVRGQTLKGQIIAEKEEISIFVVDAFFKIWEEKGLGYCSRSVGEYRYHAQY